MVKPVSAFAAEDGTVFPTELEAAIHEAKKKLTAFDKFQAPTVIAIIEHRQAVYDALIPLITADLSASGAVDESIGNEGVSIGKAAIIGTQS